MNRHGIRLSLGLGLLAFAADRLHKYVQLDLLHWPEGHSVGLLPFLNVTLVYNRGISYGLLGSLPVIGIAALVAVALVALAVWWWRANSVLIRAGLALCIGGALSNALDRWLYGAVADFFHLYWQQFDFFVFNVADAAITLGVLLLLLDLVGIGRQKSANAV